MRTAFIKELICQARQHLDVFLVVGDLGYSVVEPFAAEFPDRYLNAGVAEQNMTGVAAGLASEGYHVFTYSIANFPTLRCLEQIRNDVCYHNFPVTIVAVGGGLAYGNLGFSHHGIQDMAVMRTLPCITVLAPADPGETRQAVDYLVANPGPSYLRLGKAGERVLHDQFVDFSVGLVEVCHGGNGDAIVCTGSALSVGMDAVQALRKLGRDPSLFSCPVIAPIRTKQFDVLRTSKQIVSVEDHVSAGGLGELLKAALPRSIPVSSMCVSLEAIGCVGSEGWLRKESGISAQGIVDLIVHPQKQMLCV